jgi:hypothetical protein
LALASVVAIDSQSHQTIEKHSKITTEEINKIYTITMQNIKFNTSREVIFLLLAAPILLTTPAYANNKPGREFVDPTQIAQSAITVEKQRKEWRLCKQRLLQQSYPESVAAETCAMRCEKKGADKVLPINQRLQEEFSRRPSSRSVINSLEKQRLEIFMEMKRCRY